MILFSVSIIALIVLLLIFPLKRLHQPYLVTYILAGIILGPHISGVFTNPDYISTLGGIGILLYLFLGTTVSVMLINSLLSAMAFRLLKFKWRTSIYAGAFVIADRRV